MAGFLNALGWAAPVLGGTSFVQQDYQNAQQKAASEQGFASAINSLGPGYEWAQNWLKQAGPGATPDIAAALGGNIGKVFTQQAMSGKLASIWDDPNKSPEQKLSEAAAIDPEYGKYFGELAVSEAKLGSGFKPSNKLGDYLDLQGVGRADWDQMNAEQKKAMMPGFLDFLKSSSAGGDKSPFTPEQLQELSQVDPRFGQVARDYPTAATTMSKDKFIGFANSLEKPSPAAIATMEQQQMAIAGLSDMKQVGDIVLPDAPPGGRTAALAAKGYREWLAARGDPMMGAYFQTQTAIVTHMRALAGTPRVNQKELELSAGMLQNAASKGQLDNAVFLANRALQRAYEIIKNNGYVVVGQGKDLKVLTPNELAAMGGGIGSGVDTGGSESESAPPASGYESYPGETPGEDKGSEDDPFLSGSTW